MRSCCLNNIRTCLLLPNNFPLLISHSQYSFLIAYYNKIILDHLTNHRCLSAAFHKRAKLHSIVQWSLFSCLLHSFLGCIQPIKCWFILVEGSYFEESEFIFKVVKLFRLCKIKRLWEKWVHLYIIPPNQVFQTMRQSYLRRNQWVLQKVIHYLEILEVISAHISLFDGKF